MSRGCGITIDFNSQVYQLKSVAVSDVKPVDSTDAVSVKNDNKTMKRGRVAGAVADSPLAYNRQSDLRMSLTSEDLGTLRQIQDQAGATSVLLYVGRIDLFRIDQYDTPQNVILLQIDNIKRTAPNYYNCRARIVRA